MDITGKGIEEAAKVLPEVYKDAAQPAVREVGSALGRAVRIALSPVRGLAWTWEHAEGWLEEQIEKRLEQRRILPESVVSPPPQLAAGAIRGVQAAGPESDATLRDAFASLLATSMERERADEVHPAFADVLSNLTPDEARILRQLGRRLPQPIVASIQVAIVMGMFAKHVGEDAEFEVLTNEVELGRPSLVTSYLENLQRLGLISISHTNIEPSPPNPQSRTEGQQEERWQILAYLRQYGVAEASQARALFLSKSRTVLWKNLMGDRAWMDLRMIYPTAFGSQLLRATTEPGELSTLSRITDDDIGAEAEEEGSATG